MFNIHVDVRESRQVFDSISRLADKKGFTFERAQLPVGDVVCGNVCIERKAAPDFHASLVDKRLDEQTTKMCLNFEHKWIVVEGDLFNIPSNLSTNCIIGQQIAIIRRKNVHIVYVPDTDGFAWAVYGIITKIMDGKLFTLKEGAIMKTGQYTDHDILTNMIGVIPGVGFARAKTIVKDFGISNIQEFNKLTWTEFRRLRKEGKLVRVTKGPFGKILELFAPPSFPENILQKK